MLAVAVGPALTKYMHELLDQMFSAGLTEALRQALVDMSTHIPPLLPDIQGGHPVSHVRQHVLIAARSQSVFSTTFL